MTHTKTTAVVWGSEPPAHSIGREKPMWPGDSGFTVLFDDAPDPDDVHGTDDPRISLVCLHCLLDDHPEIGRGLDIARESTEWQIWTRTTSGSWATSAASRRTSRRATVGLRTN